MTKSEYDKLYYLKNKEKIKENTSNYYYNNKEKCSKSRHEYYINNKEEIDKDNNRWAQMNRSTSNGYKKQYRLKNIDKIKSNQYIKTYGITLEQKNQMIKDQNGLCGCCGESMGDNPHNMHMDHCHITNKIRKVLCSKCNHALGLMGESEKKVLLLLEYTKYCNGLKNNAQ
jgi:hypothetical protein